MRATMKRILLVAVVCLVVFVGLWVIPSSSAETEAADGEISNDVTGQSWQIAWGGKELVKAQGPICSIYVRSIKEVGDAVELNIVAIFGSQQTIPQQFRLVAVDNNGKTRLGNSKVTVKQNDGGYKLSTYSFHAPFKGLKLENVKEFQLQFKYPKKINRFDKRNGVEPDGWETKWHGKTPMIADMAGGSVLVGTLKEDDGQLRIHINDTFYNGTESRIVAVDNKGRIHTGMQTSKIVPNKQYRTTEASFANIRIKDIKEFRFQIRLQRVTIELSAIVNRGGFDKGETVQLHATVTSESDKELIITEGEYGFRLIVDGKEYLWSHKTMDVHPANMRMNKGDVRTVLITIEKDEWRSAKDGRKFLELNPGRHRIQAIAVPHPSSELKGRIYSNMISFKVESDESEQSVEQWGEAVEGVKLRLRADKRVWKVGEVPTFQVDIHNGSIRHLYDHHRLDSSIRGTIHEFEFDGHWHRDFAKVNRMRQVVQPGKEWAGIVVRLDRGWELLPKLTLKPGRHTLRVAFNGTLYDPRDADYTKPVRAVSNPVEIEIQATTQTP